MFQPTERQKLRTRPDLSEVLDAFGDGLLKNINCCQVGYIESFNATDQTATVRLASKQVKDITLNGRDVLEERSLLVQCPVLTLSDGFDAHITFPIKKGAGCIVVFNDRDIDNWFFDSGVRKPNTQRKHDLSDAFAIVGVRSQPEAISDYSTNSVNIRYNADCSIDMKEDEINSLVTMWKQDGSLTVTGSLFVGGQVIGFGGLTDLEFDINITQTSGKEIHAGNGATGTFNQVTVVDGIVVGGI